MEVTTLGCFLIATMASLRFRDLLRTKPESLSKQRHILRGISWRTKTSVSGQPWGVCCLGFTTRPSTGHWVFRFLEALQLGIDKTRENWGANCTPDFLLPPWTDSIPFSTRCSYHHALALIRFYSQCCWLSPALPSPEQAANLSTHSLKSILLAAAGHLDLNLENRAKQGHHKKSVQLDLRDDVWLRFFLQRDILVDVSNGWRPLTSQARGAKKHYRNLHFVPLSLHKMTSIWCRCYRERQLHRLLPARNQLIPRKLLTTLMNKVKIPLLFLHLLIQANHGKRKLPLKFHHQSW